MKTNLPSSRLKYWNFLILALSIYVLGSLFASAVLPLNYETKRLLDIVDDFICIIFIVEFVVRFFTAKEKLQFLKWGWIDLLSSIPSIEILRFGRVFRLFKILRILKAFRSIKHVLNFLFQDRPNGAFLSASILGILLIISSSIAILHVETVPESNIKTAEDALWWSYVTITTVGYGDKFPVTSEGRVVAVFLMTAGMGLFGTFTGFIASWFMAKK